MGWVLVILLLLLLLLPFIVDDDKMDEEVVDEIKSGKFTLPRKFIGIGAMDENWGYLSTHILNRTCLWGMHFGQDLRQHPGMIR